MKVKGTNYNKEEVEFNVYLCECPMDQDYVCGHWYVNHVENCSLEITGQECVKSCSGGWYGTRSYLNNPFEIKRNRAMMWKDEYNIFDYEYGA